MSRRAKQGGADRLSLLCDHYEVYRAVTLAPLVPLMNSV